MTSELMSMEWERSLESFISIGRWVLKDLACGQVDVETCLKLNVVTSELEFRGLGDATPSLPGRGMQTRDVSWLISDNGLHHIVPSTQFQQQYQWSIPPSPYALVSRLNLNMQ